MRQLFVPACLCLMTLSGSIGDDPKMSLDQFTGAQRAEATAAETEALVPGDEDVVAQDETAAVIVPIDAPITIPTQSDSTQALTQAEATPLPKPKPEIKPVIYRSAEEVCDTLTKAAQSNNLPVPFFIRLLFQESHFSPAVVSAAGAQGIAQFMPQTASDMGVDNPFDPVQAIPASARLLRSLFEKFGNLGLAAAAYNAGPKRIQDWLSKKGSLPQETQGYVKTITGRPAENWKASEDGTPAVKLPRHAPCQEAAGLLAWNGPEQIPVPAVAPHRRPAAAAVQLAAQAKPAERKTDVKNAHHGARVAAVIRVADASASMPHAAVSAMKPKHDAAKKDTSQKNAPKKGASKKDTSKKIAVQKDGKGALQLAARQRHKKVHVSQR